MTEEVKVDVWRVNGAPKEGTFWVRSDPADMVCVNVPSSPNSPWLGEHVIDIWTYCLDKGWTCTIVETHRVEKINSVAKPRKVRR